MFLRRVFASSKISVLPISNLTQVLHVSEGRCWPKSQAPHSSKCTGVLINSEPIHIEDEVKDQEDEVEEGRNKWRVRREGRREIKHTSAWNMDEMTRTNTLSQRRVRHHYTCAQNRENVMCQGVLFTLTVGCSRSPSAVNDLSTTNFQNIYELHQFSFHCHHEVLEEEDECHLWHWWK